MPISPQTHQMLLGTILGDGFLDRSNTCHPRYGITHSVKQRAYCLHKAELLDDYIKTPPRTVANGGYGEENIVFRTLTNPDFTYYWDLCYRLDRRTGRFRKVITHGLLRELDWQGLAYFYMDDGSLQGTVVHFHTEGFAREEVELLVQELQRRGLQAKSLLRHSRHNPNTHYWIISLSVNSSYRFLERIREYMVPPMAYKFQPPQRAMELVCGWCGRCFEPRGTQAVYDGKANGPSTSEGVPCCGEKACLQDAHNARNHKYMDKPGTRENKNARQRIRYQEDIEQERTRCREKARKSRKEHPERAKAAKAKYLRKKQAERRAQHWKCQRCGLTEPRGDKPSNLKYCPDCKAVAKLEVARKYNAKHRKTD